VPIEPYISDPLIENTCNSIARLHQKLKDLQEEVTVRLLVLAGDDIALNSQKKVLTTLANEVDQALQGIDKVVSLTEING
jgi:enhancing lycopene biosynthesis protein 2